MTESAYSYSRNQHNYDVYEEKKYTCEGSSKNVQWIIQIREFRE